MEEQKYIRRFARNFYDPENKLTFIGGGELGGKARGLLRVHTLLNEHFKAAEFPEFNVNVPTLTVLRTDVFDAFMQANNLYDIATSDLPDERIALAFQKAQLPFAILGDLRALIADVHKPLAVRSSSLLEDAMLEPFAGIYGTKMTPNNQTDTDSRFQKLVEAIKFVYASTFFKAAKEYMQATSHTLDEEKMAVIIQEVVGKKQESLFYPDLSGVGRSYNYYAFGQANPEEGIVNLALGLGKTIVDGGLSWSYSPALPKVGPPFGSISDLMKNTQTRFWAVNMANTSAYHPTRETEYLLEKDLDVADKGKNLKYTASTLDSQSGRIVMGIGKPGPRILNFAPLLRLNEPPLNTLLERLMQSCEKEYQSAVEIEFAVNFSDEGVHQFGFLQARPMHVSHQEVNLSEETEEETSLVYSNRVLGNGIEESLHDIIYVKPQAFNVLKTHEIAHELDTLNALLLQQKKAYVLMGFGRWGTSDASAGIPINWGQISGAKVIVEASLQNMRFEQSQGSHFFHNVSGFQVYYFAVDNTLTEQIDWDWLNQQTAVFETSFIRHIRLSKPVRVMVDGRSGHGRIYKPKQS